MDSYDFLERLLISEFGARPHEIHPEATLSSLGLDSLSAAELIREVEEEFGVTFSDEDVGFSTLGEAAAIVDGLVNRKNS